MPLTKHVFARAEFAGEGDDIAGFSSEANRWTKAMVPARLRFNLLRSDIPCAFNGRPSSSTTLRLMAVRFQSAATGMAIAASACRHRGS